MILCIGTTPAAQRIMVFATLTLDHVNRAALTVDGAAGKSINVAKVLKAMGENPLAVGVSGGARASQILGALRELSIDHDFVATTSPTRECVTVIDQSNSTITELVEESHAISSAEAEQLLDCIRRHAPKCRAMVMSGTIAPGCPLELYATCTKLARASGALAVVDAQGEALIRALPEKPALVKPNRTELAATVRRELGTDSDVLAAARDLMEQGASRVVVTAGKNATLASDGNQAWRITAPRIQAVNPIGSGDSFTAGLTARLLRGDDLGEACRWATAAGAANALNLMAGQVKMSDLEGLLPHIEVENLSPRF